MVSRNPDRPRLAETPESRHDVAREMIRQVARRMRLSTSTSFMGYGLQALLLIDRVPGRLLIAWVVSVALCEVFNNVVASKLLGADDDPARGARLLVMLQLGLGMCGGSWGAVILLPGVGSDLQVLTVQSMFLAVAGIMSIHNLSYHPGCLLIFGLGLAGPAIGAAFMHRFPVHLAVAGAALVVVTQIYGWSTRRLMFKVIGTNIVNEQVTAELQRSHDELTEVMDRLRRLASLDSLTQCLNRRALMEEMARELARCERYDSSFGLIMLDLDHFKSINDRYGHTGGDAVLVGAATRLRSQLRPTDFLGRWGGEEFLCLLTHASHEAVEQKAEAMRRSLANPGMEVPGAVIHVTASIGVVMYRPGRTLEELIEAVDSALYRAKNSGRNRVCA